MQRWNAHFCLSEPGVSVPQRLESFFSTPAKRSLRSAEFVFFQCARGVLKGQKHILSHRSRRPTNETKDFPLASYPLYLSFKPSLTLCSASASFFRAVRPSPFVVCDTSDPNSAQLPPQNLSCSPTRYMRVTLQASAKLCRTKHLSQDKEIPASIRLDERQILQSLLPPAFLPEELAHLQNHTSDSPSIISRATCATNFQATNLVAIR
jgi:hypothetical protein